MNLRDAYNWTKQNVVNPALGISEYYGVPKASASTGKYQLKDRGVQITDEDIQAIRPLLYGELSNRTPEKQMLEANVILNTALNRMKAYESKGIKKSLAEVVAMPNQYQAYGSPQYKQYANPKDAPSLAKKKQVDAIVDTLHGKIRSGVYPDTTNGAYYYIHNPDRTITYDDKKPLFAN